MNQEVKVGIFVLVALVVLAIAIVKLGGLPSFREEAGYEIIAIFDAAAGLNKDDRVLYAGVNIGRVAAIKLKEGKAWVTLRIKPEVEIPVTARARLSMIGLLGEKYVEVFSAKLSDKFLKSGERLQTEPSVDMNTILFQLKDLGDNITEVSSTFKDSLRDVEGESRLEHIFENLDQITGDLRIILSTNRENIDHILDNVDNMSAEIRTALPETVDKLNGLVEKLDLFLEENRGSLGQGIDNFKDVSNELKKSVDSMNRILEAIEKQEGTIGKLIYDDEAHEKLTSTLDSAERTVGRAEQITSSLSNVKLGFGVRSEYFADDENLKNYFSLAVRPSDRDFLLFELIDDKTGLYRDISGQGFFDGEEGEFSATTRESGFTYSAQYGRHFGVLSLRGGLFESEFGGAVGLSFLEDRLYFDLQGYDFAREGGPHLKLTGSVALYKYIYLGLGMDDFVDDEKSQPFIAAGLLFR